MSNDMRKPLSGDTDQVLHKLDQTASEDGHRLLYKVEIGGIVDTNELHSLSAV